ncbi:hypothetical protein SODALDRAFT_358993 [Sodiomyces alkalinus F11]|uniref:Uncharacterized protein n=1 Tax=Sodiomyces alkalinus (strain CBS 110278 / VKM F-3762 / F11) TaxID=1314773 RepID=A0A3N2PXB1_SODAK|nr:hypothetical protein SODALDRAFT_358993 [Sodiomyces alkalinus F11]ROT39127.1 hypothetical protein SODALDRAFT_358993 [Sodiomyces alkalinus F11]
MPAAPDAEIGENASQTRAEAPIPMLPGSAVSSCTGVRPRGTNSRIADHHHDQHHHQHHHQHTSSNWFPPLPLPSWSILLARIYELRCISLAIVADWTLRAPQRRTAKSHRKNMPTGASIVSHQKPQSDQSPFAQPLSSVSKRERDDRITTYALDMCQALRQQPTSTEQPSIHSDAKECRESRPDSRDDHQLITLLLPPPTAGCLTKKAKEGGENDGEVQFSIPSAHLNIAAEIVAWKVLKEEGGGDKAEFRRQRPRCPVFQKLYLPALHPQPLAWQPTPV